MGQTKIQDQPNNETFRVHDGKDGFDVVIDHSEKGVPSTNETFEMKKNSLTPTSKSEPQYRSFLPMEDKKLEVKYKLTDKHMYTKNNKIIFPAISLL